MNQASKTETSLSAHVEQSLAVSLRGCEELLPRDEWVKKLQRHEKTGQPLRIKLGLDPTAPDIHIGHTVVLNKKAPEKANKSLADGVNVLNPHSTRAAPPQTPSASNRAIHSKVNAFTGLVLGISAG